jgi:hypothetical protein
MRTVHVLRKPVAGTSVAESVLTYGAGALNVDGTRVSVAGGEPDSGANYYRNRGLPMPSNRQSYFGQDKGSVVTSVPMPNGRWPANLILQHLEGCGQDGTETVAAWVCASECPVAALDQQSGAGQSPRTYQRSKSGYNKGTYSLGLGEPSGATSLNYGDAGGASRFFKQVQAKLTGGSKA